MRYLLKITLEKKNRVLYNNYNNQIMAFEYAEGKATLMQNQSKKMWEGRFKKALDSRVNDFNSSISFDSRMYREDIMGSTAHAKMLAKQGIISEEDKELIVKGLADICAGGIQYGKESQGSR